MLNIDNELLRFAALAAGYEVDGFPWNPLEDDKDAFRLAVLLRLHTFMSTPNEQPQKAYAGRYNEVPWTSEVTSTPCAAMRRAIVCAAAEIGLLKKCGEPHE